MRDSACKLGPLESHMTGCVVEWEKFQEDVYFETTSNEVRETYGAGTKGEHELLDRIFMLSTIMEHLVATHASLVFHPQAYRYLYLASGALMEAYQAVGGASGTGDQADSDGDSPVGLREEVPGAEKEG